MRRNKNKKLSKTHKQFQSLFNSLPDPAVIVDAKGKFLAINNKVEKITGFKREELLGRNFLATKIATAQSKALLKENLRLRLRGIHVAPYEIKVLKKDGRKSSCEVSAVKIEYEGQPADFIVFHGIKERKAMEERL